MAKQTLVRMFFDNGHIEVRPLDRVSFVNSQEFSTDKGQKDFKCKSESMQEDGEIYVAFVDQLIALQVYRDTFVDVRLQRKHSRSSQGDSH